MIGKHVVIDTLDNFKAKLDQIPSSAIVLIKDVGQIYAHGTYFGAQKTYSLLTKTADGLAPKGGTSASSQISDVDTEWVLTVTNGENPTWRKLPANAFNSSSYTLPSATASDLGGIKVGQVYTATFDDLVGQYYKINVDKNGLAYVHVPWVNNPYTASGSGITLKDNVFSLSLNSATKLDQAIGNKIYAVSLDKNGKLCVSVPWVDTNNIFTGATETKNGSSGMVPAPIAKQHNHFLKGDGTWVKPNLSDFTDDVVSGKYLPLTGGELKGTTASVLFINTNVTDDVGIVFKLNGSINKGWVGYSPSIGTYLYNSTSKKYLGIKDDGTLYYSNGTIWHSDNDGSGSGLDADKLDGYHASSFFRSRGWLSVQTDLNTVVDNSINSLNGDNGKYTNSPINYGNLISFGDSDSSYKYGKVQFLTSSSTELYVRNNFNGWKDWKQVAFVDDVPTVTDYYWANVKIKSSEDKTTTPTFGSATVSGNTKTDTITITNTSGTGHINFSRASYNYITTPASGAIILLPGLEVSGSLGYQFTSTEFRPGVTNTYILGTSSLQWKGLFISGSINSSLTTSTHLAGNQGKAIIDSQAAAGSYTMLAKMNSNNGYFTHGTYKDGYTLYYTAKSTVDAGTNTITKTATLLNEDGDSVLSGYANAAGFKRAGSDNNYVLLGGGSHKAVSDFQPSGNYAGSDASGGKAYYSYKLYYASTATLSTKAAIDGFLEAYTFKAQLWNGSNAENNLSTSYPGAGNGTILSGGYSSTNYGFQLAIDDDPNWFMALRQRGNGTWSAWKRIPMGDGTGASGTWSINITGSAGSAGNADTLDSQHGDWYRKNVLGFTNTGYSATNEYNCNTLKDGIIYNYGSSAYWKNGPTGMSYGQVLNLRRGDSYSLMGQLAWDVNHASTTDTTRYLWWRASDDGSLTEAKWHQIAFTDTKVQNASNADVATKLARAEYLESDDAINGFLEANRFKFAQFKTTAQNQIGMSSYDGMLLSIPWGDTAYGFQMAFDDSTNCVIKARGKAVSWGTWRTLYHTGNLTKVSQLTNDSGYLTSRGYIGTTAVQASSASQNLTGIGWINGGIKLNKANDDCGRIQGLGHGLEFGGPGYAHMNYYFRPHYGTSGSTLTSVYIQNASADSAPTFTTTHSFSSAGNASHSGTVTSTGFIKSGSSNSYVLLGGGGHKTESSLSVSYAASAGNADTVDNYHASSLVKFYLSPLESNAPAASAKTWFTNTMPSKSGAIVYNVPGSEKTIIAGKSSGSYGHMLQLNYDDNYLRILRYFSGSWKTTDWEKISAGYADSAGNADTIDNYHISVGTSAGTNSSTIYFVT